MVARSLTRIPNGLLDGGVDMKRRKQIPALLFSVCAALSITACSGDNDTGPKPADIANTPAASASNSEQGDPSGGQPGGDGSAVEGAPPSGPPTYSNPDPPADDKFIEEVNETLENCINEATEPLNTKKLTDLSRRCFFSTPILMPDIYAIRSISPVNKSATYTTWATDIPIESAKEGYKTETTVFAGERHAATVYCYWDSFLKSCKLDKINFTEYGLTMMNQSARDEAGITVGGLVS